MRPVCILLALMGCISTPEPPEKAKVWDPNTSVAFFTGAVKSGEYDLAYQALSADTKKHLPMEGLVLAMDSYPSLRRVLGATEAHHVDVSGERARVRLCNAKMGVSYEIGLKKEFGKLWAIDISAQELQELTQIGKDWLALQWEDDLGRTLFPPDARPRTVNFRCECGRKRKVE